MQDSESKSDLGLGSAVVRGCVMAHAARPGPVALKSGNIAAEWTHFKQKFEIFLVASQQENAPSSVKWALLLGEAGNDALEVYNSFKDKLLVTSEVLAQDGTLTKVVEDNTKNYEKSVAGI